MSIERQERDLNIVGLVGCVQSKITNIWRKYQ